MWRILYGTASDVKRLEALNAQRAAKLCLSCSLWHEAADLLSATVRLPTRVKSDLFEAALLRTQKTWKTYVTALCALNLGFLIDALGGFHFFQTGGEINVAGFKVVREALSATYGLLFLAFIAATFYESRLLKTLSQTAVHFPESPELELWFLSPFSRSWLGRFFRKCLFLVGYFCLAVFSVIHITNTSAPQTNDIRARLYVPIGYGDGLILFVCVYLGVKICQNLRFVRHQLEMIEGRNT